MAYLDLTMAIYYFEEVNKRLPRPTEMGKLRALTLNTPILAGKKDYMKAWEGVMRAMGAVPEDEVNWKEAHKWGL